MAVPDASPPPTASLLGGRYRLVRQLAQGGMATVWEGYDTVLARAVAIKVLHPHLATDQLFLERFRREAIAAARLSHPNVVATFDAGSSADGAAFIVMELVRGITLRQFLTDRGPFSPALATGIAVQIADALAHAHAAGLIHRDIKPGNVLICDTESSGIPRIKVTDFGIAKAAEGLGLDLTRTGTILGTPKYLSPEQIDGREPDTRADLYSLGVVLYEMVAGVPPFNGPTDMATAVQHLNAAPPRLSSVRSDVPPRLDYLVAALLAKRPDQRPPSAAVVFRELRAIETSDHSTGGMAPTRPVAAIPSAPAADTVPPTMVSRTGPYGPAPQPGAVGPPPTAGGPRTAVLDPTVTPSYPPPYPARLPRRRANWPGRIVAGLVVIALIVVVVVFVTSRSSGSSRHPAGGTTSPTAASAIVPISAVSVFNLERNGTTNDDAADVAKTFDGIPGTVWQTDIYYTRQFGGLHPHGFGLAIALDGRHKLHQLRVTSTSQGWSGQVYVADRLSNPPALAPWGTIVDSQQVIKGSPTFNLGGRQGSYILFWITVLGPSRRVSVDEFNLS